MATGAALAVQLSHPGKTLPFESAKIAPAKDQQDAQSDRKAYTTRDR